MGGFTTQLKLKISHLETLFLIFCFFPYVQIINLGTDSQPYALALSLLLFPLLIKQKISKDIFYLAILFVSSIAVAIICNAFSFNAIRSIVNYGSLFLVGFATFRILERSNGLNYSLFKVVCWLWFIVGAVQTLLYPKFLTFLTFRAVGSGDLGRGAVGLAPEPTFYGVAVFVFIVVYFINFSNKRDYLLLSSLIIQLIFFSKSSTVIMVLGASSIFFGLYSLIASRASLKQKLSIAVGVSFFMATGIAIFNYFLSDSRAYFLLVKLYENPYAFMLVDGSVNERFIHFFFPILGFIQHWGLPSGIDTFNEYMKHIYASGRYDDLLFYYRDNYSRIMSGYGSALFELGIIALIIPIVLYRNFRPLFRKNHVFVLLFISINGILFNAVPFSNSLIAFLFGNIIFIGSIEKNQPYPNNANPKAIQ